MTDRHQPDTEFNRLVEQYERTPDAGAPDRQRSTQRPRRIRPSRGAKRVMGGAAAVAATAALALGANGEATPDAELPYGPGNPDVAQERSDAMSEQVTQAAGEDHELSEGEEVDPNPPT